MAENDQVQAASESKFGVQRVYIKDSSFEAPNSPECFRQPYTPQVDFSITSQNRAIEGEDNVYEVVLKLTANVKQDDKTVYLAEVQQAGVFEIVGINDPEMLSQILGVTCPTILFPYGREAIDSLAIKGSFPALMLAPVSFDAIYAQAKRNRDEQAEATAGADA